MPSSPLLLGARDLRSRVTRMGGARIAVGLTGVRPDVGARIFGAPLEEITPITRLLARFFAVRNIVLGSWVLTMRAAKGGDLRRCVQLNLAVDVADLAAITPLLARARLRRTAVMAAVLATSAILGWRQILEEL